MATSPSSSSRSLRSANARETSEASASIATPAASSSSVDPTSAAESPSAWGSHRAPTKEKIDYIDTGDHQEVEAINTHASSSPGGEDSSSDGGRGQGQTDDGDGEGEDNGLISPPSSTPPRSVGKMKAMLIAYTMVLLLGFALSVLSDISRLVPPLIKFSLGLQIASSIFFCLVVPLTHFSGSLFHRKWRFYQPFIGGTRFILFQTLSWFFYALCLILAISCLLFWSSLARYTFGVLTSFGVFGVLSQVFMVSSIFVYERQKMHQRKKKKKQRAATTTTTNGSSSANSAGAGDAAKEAGSTTTTKPSAGQKLVNLLDSSYRETFFHHNLVLAIVAVALAILAEYLWFDKTTLTHHRDFARGAGALSVLLFTTVVFNTYGVGGRMTHHHHHYQWRFWQPFFGGARFILLQALSWSFFTISVLVEIAFIISTFALGFELFVGAAVVAGLFFLVSEVLMIVSLHFYIPTESTTKDQQSVVSFTNVKVDEESLEQFRRLTVITILSNMQYLPFLLPILPFLACGLSLSDAGPHWFAFFCCLTAGVVVNAYVKQLLAKSRRKTKLHNYLAQGLPLLIYSFPILGIYHSWLTRASIAWILLTALHYLYIFMTFRGNPEVNGQRYLGEALEFWPGGFSLYTFMDGIDQYFKGHMIWMESLDMKKPHIFAFHPHGVQPFTVFWIQLSRAWREHMKGKRFTVMTASVMHYVPLMRDILQWLGGREVSKESIINALSNQESIMLVPGGQQEMMESQSKMEEIRVVTKHVGFIRIAIQHGVPLVPVLSFGEVEVMDFVRMPRLQRFFIKRIGIPIPFFPYGLFGFPIPRPVPVTVVFGKSLPVKQIVNPTPAQVEAVSKIYFQRIEEIFEMNKQQALGHANHRLTLVR